MAHMHDALRRRRSIRLKGYDYSGAGAYFVTIVALGRLCLFGEVVGEEVRLNEAGTMARRTWETLSRRFPGIGIDAFVVMPNHIHGIVIIDPANAASATVGVPLVGTPDATHTPDAPGRARATTRVAANAADVPDRRARATTRVAPTGAPNTTLGDVVGAYKSLTTVEYASGVGTLNWPPFERRLWHRNYYEHVVRNEESLSLIRQYILDNPAQWVLDRENPAALRPQVAL